MSSNTENTMNMDISTQMAAFIKTHGGLDLGEFYKWFEGSSPEEIIRNYNSMLLAKYNKEVRGKLEKISVEKDVSSIKKQLESLQSLVETIDNLYLVDEDLSSIKKQLESLPSGESLHGAIGGLSRVEETVRVHEEQLALLPERDTLYETMMTEEEREQLGSLPSGESLYETIAECKDLKDTIKEMYKTMDVLMNENIRLSSLIEKKSNVSNNQLEWAELAVCRQDLINFLKKEWINKELTIGHLKYFCYGENGHDFSVEMTKFNNDRHSATKLSMDEFLLSIERLFKINIPSIYDDVHLHLEIRDVSVTTRSTLLEIPDQTVGAWLKEIREFPGKLRANPDSYFLIKRKDIIPPVIFSIIGFMVGSSFGNPGESWIAHNKFPLLKESNKRQLAWQRELVKGNSQSI